MTREPRRLHIQARHPTTLRLRNAESRARPSAWRRVPRVCSTIERMRAQLPNHSMTRTTSSGGSSSGNTDGGNNGAGDDNDDAGNGNGTGRGSRSSSNRSGSDNDGGSDNIRAEFRELLTSVAGLRPAEREERLLRENFKVRDRLRTSQQQLAEAKKGGVPQGAVVLTGDDATAYTAFQKTGVALKDVPTRLAERDTLHAEKGEREARALNERVAHDLGLNPRAFAMFAKANDLVISFKEVRTKNEDGKFVTEEVPMVRKKGDADDKAKPLSEALEGDFSEDDLVLLTTDAAPSRGDERDADALPGVRSRSAGTGTTDDAAQSGVRFPSQRTAAPSGASTQRKQDEKARESKVGTGRYSM